MILNLPPELIQLVLQNCNTPAFLEAAFSCRIIHEIASTCREVLLHHLRRTPGIVNRDLRSLSSKQLFRLLTKNAFQQLYGAQHHADRVIYDFGNDVLDVKASTFSSFDHQTLALVARGREKVYLFCIEHGQLRPLREINLPYDRPGICEVLQTAFDGDGGLYVLQRFVPAMDVTDTNANHPFIKQAMQSNINGMNYLSCHSLDSPGEPVRVCAFPDHANYKPLALAAMPGGSFAISWQHNYDCSENEVVLYTASTNPHSSAKSGVIDISYDSCVLLERTREQNEGDRFAQSRNTRNCLVGKGPVVGLAFNDRSSQLLYRYRAQALYGSFQKIDLLPFPTQSVLYENSCPVQFSDYLTLLFGIGVPFFGTHETRVQNGLSRCHWKYLSFGIATHREEDWTVACLLTSEAVCRASNCEHELHLERGRRLPDWTIVARLRGFENSNTSLGCIVAASRLGTRIAVANWKTIYIWALEPGALIEHNATGFYPVSSWPPGSEAIDLQPIALSLDAVCFQLRFGLGENDLVAITDRGLVYCDLDPSGGSHRTVYQLGMESAPGS
ncbi:F-box domain-containing protein [Aspergillus costaricaensis CBS 115574]|uniref:F-box domain-containing protein n=1 Tax=Aspergillus costaricaensis CBS 115574 TaxID=1448317 RepID=A0ACD1I1V3_9EURO|nr:F-box domain-containing protein [Aspergillus costaricaensis CBS 115574]RAK84269.1 F-box domain-containing protein [Aspergillus costaricaensis CBS 115574]